jgi:hypothetical protein
MACAQVARSYHPDRGPGGHDPEKDVRACVDLLKAKIKNGAYRARHHIFVPVVLAAAHALRSLTMVIPAPGMVPRRRHQLRLCLVQATRIEGVIGALDSHEFVFAWLMTLANALSCTWACAFFSPFCYPSLLELTRSFLPSLRGHAIDKRRWWRRFRKPGNRSQ